MVRKECLKFTMICSFLTTPLLAEDHVVVGHEKRDIQEEATILHDQKKCEVTFQEEVNDEVRSPDDAEEVMTSGSFYDNLHSGCYHKMSAKGANGEMFDTEDGAIWSVYPNDMHTVKYWQEGDIVLIGTSSYLFSSSLDKSSYRYEAFNTNKRSRARINLSQGPFPSKCRALNRVDGDIVSLNDGSYWEVSGFDSGLLRKWKWVGKEGSERQAIIIGLNHTISSSWDPYILINVDTNDYVRARFLYNN